MHNLVIYFLSTENLSISIPREILSLLSQSDKIYNGTPNNENDEKSPFYELRKRNLRFYFDSLVFHLFLRSTLWIYQISKGILHTRNVHALLSSYPCLTTDKYSLDTALYISSYKRTTWKMLQVFAAVEKIPNDILTDLFFVLGAYY